MSVRVEAPNREPQVPEGAPMYVPSSTAEDFIHACASGPASEFRVLVLMGSRGSGKTTAVVYAMIALAHRLIQDGLAARLPLRVAVIRDTFENLLRTTVASLRKQSARGVPIALFDGQKQAYVGPEAAPWLHLYFFGMDNRSDVDKLQGFECSVLWPEEVAPGAELDVGIPAEVFGMGATSVRQEGVPHRILMSMNPPDSDHWSLQVDQVLMSKGIKNLVFRRFEIPPGERSEHFRAMAERAVRSGRLIEARQWREAADEFDQYRQLNEAFLESIGRHDLVARMVHGRVGSVQIGEAVASTFVHELHVTQPGESLILIPGSQIIRAWDGGGQPSCCPADTRVVMADGRVTRIDEIRVGDHVMTARGDPPSVLDAQIVTACGPTGWKPCVLIETKHRWLRVSHDHPVLVAAPERAGWTRAGDTRTRWYCSQWKCAGEVKAGDWLVSAIRTPVQLPASPPSMPWPVSEALLEIVGAWLGDGYYAKRKGRPMAIQLAAYHPLLAERWQRRMTEAFGAPAAVYRGRKGEQVSLNRAASARAFQAAGMSGYSATKRLPPWVYGLAPSLRLACLRGLLDSDGTVLKQGTVRFLMKNVALVWDIWALCQTLGIQTTTVRAINHTGGYMRPEHRGFYGTLSSTDAAWALIGSTKWPDRLKQPRITRGRIRVAAELEGERVMRVRRGEIAELVYNCQVADGGTFLAQGVVTHNTVWVQETGAGNVDILGARTSINLAMAQHILNEVVPFQEKKKLYASSGRPDYRGARMAWEIRDVGDPSLFNPDEIKNSDISAGMTIDEMLNTSLEKGVVEWPWRRDAALIAFERAALGRAHLSIVDERGQARVRPRLVRIQKEECDLLIKGLGGRWHYPVNLATGRINFDVKASKRASGLFAQPADALFYYFAQRFPAHEWIKRERKKPIPGGPGEPKDWVGA